MQISVIIVNYNTNALLKNCINSIYEQTNGITFEVIVSDNGSIDGSVEMIKNNFPQVILIENNENLGFGRANNRGTKVAKGKYILFLNTDTVLVNNALKIFYDFWEKADAKDTIGALGCNLIDENNNIVHSYNGFPSLKGQINYYFRDFLHIMRLFLLPSLRNKKLFKPSNIQKNDFFIGEVGFITGADLFVLNNKNAYFDEDFFLYCEDVELQKRMEEQNLKRLIIPGPKIKHLEHKSMTQNDVIDDIKKDFLSFAKINSAFSILLYHRKHSKVGIYYFITKLLIKLIWLNPLICKETKEFRKKLKEY